jgi:hypothetical protein
LWSQRFTGRIELLEWPGQPGRRVELRESRDEQLSRRKLAESTERLGRCLGYRGRALEAFINGRGGLADSKGAGLSVADLQAKIETELRAKPAADFPFVKDLYPDASEVIYAGSNGRL